MSEEEEELVPAKRISGDRRPGGEDEDRSIQTLAKSWERGDFFAAECGQSTQIITPGECRSDLFQTGISLFITQRGSKTSSRELGRNLEEDATTRVQRQQMFLSLTNFLLIDQNQRKALCCGFRRQILGSLATLWRARREGDRHRPPTRFPGAREAWEKLAVW